MQTPCDEGYIGKGGSVVCDNPDIFDFEMMCFACILGDYSFIFSLHRHDTNIP